VLLGYNKNTLFSLKLFVLHLTLNILLNFVSDIMWHKLAIYRLRQFFLFLFAENHQITRRSRIYYLCYHRMQVSKKYCFKTICRPTYRFLFFDGIEL